jgi:hypothetical protein
MTRNAVRSAVAAVVLSAICLVQPGPAAALLGWSQTASPNNAQAGQATAVTMTVTNDNLLALLGVDSIGCVRVNVGPNFTIQSVTITAAPAGRTWLASHAGAIATARSEDGGGRLRIGQWVRFVVSAVPLAPGTYSWTTRAFRDEDCGGSAMAGTATHTINVAPAPTPTPTATSTPTARPTSTPAPTPTPGASSLPIPTLGPIVTPLPLPTASVPVITSPNPSTPAPATPTPADATPRPADAAGDGGSEAALGSPSPPAEDRDPAAGTSQETPGGAPPDAPPNGNRSGGGSVPAPAQSAEPAGAAELAYHDQRLDLALGPIGGLGSLQIWAVPAATIGVPGIVVLLWVALQAGGTIAWLPAVKRLRGEEKRAAR